MIDLTAADVVDRLLPEATRRMVRTVDGLPDPAYAEPSGLPDWTRGHVIAHLTLNAEGLAGALAGVVEGRRVPMYASVEARDGDIDNLASKGPSVLRSRLLGACTDLTDAIDAVPLDAAATTIDRTPGGRVFTVGDVPWMRLREVEIHHADLAAGYDHSRWSAPFAAHVMDSMRTRDVADTSLTVHASDLDHSWSYGTGGPVVTGAAADLAWWLTGRGDGTGLTSEGGELPQIGGW